MSENILPEWSKHSVQVTDAPMVREGFPQKGEHAAHEPVPEPERTACVGQSDDDDATRLQDANGLLKCCVLVVEVLHQSHVGHGIDAAIRKWQTGYVAAHEQDVRPLAAVDVRLRLHQHLSCEIHSDPSRGAVCSGKTSFSHALKQHARAATHIDETSGFIRQHLQHAIQACGERMSVTERTSVTRLARIPRRIASCDAVEMFLNLLVLSLAQPSYLPQTIVRRYSIRHH